MGTNVIWFSLFLIVAVAASIISRKLSVPAGVTGGGIGILVYLGGGFIGLILLGSFFIMGTFATSWKWEVKEKALAAEHNKGKRTTGQVLANGGVAAIMGLLGWLYPGYLSQFQLMMAASFSAATADTLSSELGMVYGRRFFNILNFKRDTKGLNGVVSWEGTLCGLAGSFIIAFIFSLGYGWGINLLFIIIAGTIGNIADSLLGATLERKGYIGNNIVNFLNTLIAALAAYLLYLL